MKIKINEKQLDFLLKNQIDEQDTGETSSSYPEVGKWESGVSRGPANQIGNTKWSETVGSTLTRGKANKLK